MLEGERFISKCEAFLISLFGAALLLQIRKLPVDRLKMVLRGGGWFLECCRPKIGDERPPHTDKVNERFLVGSGRVNKVPGQHSAWWLTSRVIAPSGSPRAPIPHSEPNTHIHIPTTALCSSAHHITAFHKCQFAELWFHVANKLCDSTIYRRAPEAITKFQTFDLLATWMPKCLHHCPLRRLMRGLRYEFWSLTFLFCMKINTSLENLDSL